MSAMVTVVGWGGMVYVGIRASVCHFLLERLSYSFSFYDEVECTYKRLDGNIYVHFKE